MNEDGRRGESRSSGQPATHCRRCPARRGVRGDPCGGTVVRVARTARGPGCARRPTVGRCTKVVAAGMSNPSSNYPPSAAFFNSCWSGPSAACDTAALADFDAARAEEGLGPMTLPTQFDSMSAAEQLFVLADIERVDRGLVPVKGLSAPLDALAETGAATDSDPSFPSPFPGDEGGPTGPVPGAQRCCRSFSGCTTTESARATRTAPTRRPGLLGPSAQHPRRVRLPCTDGCR